MDRRGGEGCAKVRAPWEGSVNEANVHKLIQYILATAGEREEWRERGLTAIHVLKYLYLADLAFAERKGGVTFTEIPWRFHHFGPWDEDVCQAIEGAALAKGAEVRVLPSDYGSSDSYARYTLRDSALRDQLGDALPPALTGKLDRWIHRHANNTPSLLEEVYRTGPMLNARPGERLDFSHAEQETPRRAVPAEEPKRSRRQEKKRAELLAEARAKTKALLAQKRARKRVPLMTVDTTSARYARLVEALDVLDPGPVPTRGELEMGDGVWDSEMRKKPSAP